MLAGSCDNRKYDFQGNTTSDRMNGLPKVVTKICQIVDSLRHNCKRINVTAAAASEANKKTFVSISTIKM